MPFAVGAALLALLTLRTLLLKRQDEHAIHERIDVAAQSMVGHLAEDLEARIPSMRRITKRWERRGGTPKEEFLADVRNILSDSPGFRALEWIDPQFIVRWIEPLEGNEAALNLDIGSGRSQARITVLKLARDERTATMTPPIELVQGGEGFVVYNPIYVGDRFDGLVAGVFRIDEWLNHVFSYSRREQNIEDFEVRVFLDDQRVYEHIVGQPIKTAKLDSTASLKILGHQFSVQIRPTAQFLKKHTSPLPEVAALSGLLLSALVVALIYQFQNAIRNARRTTEANRALEAEIRERKSTMQALADVSSRLSLATQAAGIGIFSLEIADNRMITDDRMRELYGFSFDAPSTFEAWSRALHPDDRSLALSRFQQSLQGELGIETDFRVILPDGSLRYIHGVVRGEVDSKGVPVRALGVSWDITPQKLIEEEMRYSATHDALTGLPSLRLSRDRLIMAIGLARRKKLMAAVMFVDLDGFKAVNDTYGHVMGDQLLKEVANRLSSSLRAVDTVARIGGDEFLVVVTELHSRDEASQIAEKLIRVIGEPVMLKAGEAIVGASIGIALYPDHGEQAEELMSQADQAMYDRKKAGKNGYAFAADKTAGI